MDDVRAVLDAVGSERAALFGYSEGGHMACSSPPRTRSARSRSSRSAIYAKRDLERRTTLGADAGGAARDVEDGRADWATGLDVGDARPERSTRRGCERCSARTCAAGASPGAASRC